MTVYVSENAFKRIGKLIIKEDKKPIALRVSVDGGGCNGFMYNYEFVHKISPDDMIIEKDDVKVIIDPISVDFLKDCTLDFIEELGSSFFKIQNPNAKAKCGCGNSFSV